MTIDRQAPQRLPPIEAIEMTKAFQPATGAAVLECAITKDGVTTDRRFEREVPFKNAEREAARQNRHAARCQRPDQTAVHWTAKPARISAVIH